MNHLWKRSLSLIMAIFMVLAMIPANPVHVHADGVTYDNEVKLYVDANNAAHNEGITMNSTASPNNSVKAFALTSGTSVNFSVDSSFLTEFNNVATVEIEYIINNSQANNSFSLTYASKTGIKDAYVKSIKSGTTYGNATTAVAVYELNDAKLTGTALTIKNYGTKLVGIRSITVTKGVKVNENPTDVTPEFVTEYDDGYCGVYPPVPVIRNNGNDKRILAYVTITNNGEVVEAVNRYKAANGTNLPANGTLELFKSAAFKDVIAAAGVGTLNFTFEIYWDVEDAFHKVVFERTFELSSSHQWGPVTGTDATCNTAGNLSRTCEVCAYVDTYNPPATGNHTAGEPKTENVKAPTCDKAGSHEEVVYCSVCNKEMSRETKVDVATGNHTAGEVKTENAKAPTCNEAGSHDEVVYCSVCNKEMSRETKVDVATGNHTAGEVKIENAKAPTCNEAGSHDEVTYCSVCNKEMSRETKVDVATGNHTAGEVKIENAKAPTCDKEGSHDEVTYCSVCNKEMSRETKVDAATGNHTAGDVTVENNVAADCENAGSYDNVTYCTVCGTETSRKTITVAALGHKEETVAGKDATCTEDGLTEGKKCSVCNKTLNAQTVIPALGHKDGEVQIENDVEADCENAGSYDNVTYCTVCDAETSRKTITVAALGHKEETVAGKDATCTEDGLTEGKKCTVCGETTVAQTVIKSEGHKYVSTVVAPTCVNQGYTTHVCSGCSASFVDSKTPATGHSYTYTEKDSNVHTVGCANCNYTEEVEHNGEETCVCGYKAPAAVEVNTLEALLAALADNESNLPILITSPIDVREDIVLDLNGKTVNAAWNGNSTTNHIYALNLYSNVTITDTSAEKNGSINSRGIYNYGNLTLEAGAINAIDANGGYGLNNQAGSTFVMNGGIIAATNEDDHQSSSGGYDATAMKVPANCTATLNGGKISSVSDFTFAIDCAGTLNVPADSTIVVEGTHGAIYAHGSAVVTINAGTFSIPKDEYPRTDNVIYATGGSVVINGGEFIGDGDIPSGGSCVCDENGVVTINGGVFTGSSGGDVWGTTGTTIKGGSFENLTEKQYIAPGYELGEDGKVVASKVFVAEVNGTKYEDLQEAIDAAGYGDTVTILVDMELTSDLNNAAMGLFNIAADDKIILDLNGHTISVTDNSNGNFIVLYSYGDLTVKNGTIELTATKDRAFNSQSTVILNRGGNLTIESGKYIHHGGDSMAITVDNSANSFGDAYLYVKGGEIISETYIAIRMRLEDPNANGNPGNGLSFVEVTGGYIFGANRGIWGQKSSGANELQGKLTVAGGTIENTRADRGAIQIDTDSYAAQNMLVSISGNADIKGTLKGGNDEFAVSGGTFTVAVPEEYCAEGYQPKDNGDGTFGVQEAPKQVEVATLAELQAALADSSNDLPILVTAEIKIPAGEKVVLDLNGKTVTSAYQANSTSKHIYPLNVYGDLTIQDTKGNGSISGRGIYVQAGSKLTVESGSIYAIDSNGGSAMFMYGGDVVINGGHIEQKAEGTYNFAIQAPAGSTVTVNGGWVGGNHGAIAATGGKIVINGGTLVCTGSAGMTDNVVYCDSSSTMDIYGGTFVADKDIPSGGACVYDANGGVTIYGGSFSNSSGGDVWGTTGTTIKGGTFENLIEKQHIAPGYELGEDGKVVASKVFVAEVNGVSYETLKAAVAAAVENDVIVLLPGTIEEGTIKFPVSLKNVTIQGAPNKGTILKNTTLISSDGGSVIYEGITFDGIVFDGSQIVFTGNRNGEVVYKDWTITNCEFKNIVSDANAAVHFNLAADETFNGLTFTNNVIDGVSGGNVSGLRANYLSGNVTITGNKISNVAWNAIQLIHANVDTYTIENNVVASGADEGILNLYNTNAQTLSIANNQFLVNAGQAGIGYLSSGDVSGNYWGGEAPANLPEGVTCSSYYTTVESDGTLSGLTEIKNDVAEVNGVGYATLQEALLAAKAGGTITLLDDITIDSTWDDRLYINSGAIVIVGNDHTIKFTGEINDGKNYVSAFHFEADATIKNLTIDMSGVTNTTAYRAITATKDLTIENCTFIGKSVANSVAVQYGPSYAITDLQVVTVTNSVFKNWAAGITNNQNGIDTASHVTITGNRFESAGLMISATEELIFTNNIAEACRVRIHSCGKPVTMKVTATGNTIAAGYKSKISEAVSYDNIQSDFIIEAPVELTNGETTKYFNTLTEAVAAAQNGDTITLIENAVVDNSNGYGIMIGKAITIDGNGKTITVGEGYSNEYALLYLYAINGTVTIKNLTFDGVKSGAAVWAHDADLVIENCVFQNGNHTQVQGLVRTTTSNLTVKNSKFLNNNCNFAITFNFDAAENDTMIVEGCEFSGNTVNDTAVIYYVDGASSTIKNSSFVNNTIVSASHGAVLYYSNGTNGTVTGNIFSGNSITAAGARASVLALEAGTTATGNVFTGNTFSSSASGTTYVATVLNKADKETAGVVISGNYWNAGEPDYIASKDAPTEIENYYTTYVDGVMGGLTEVASFVAEVNGTQYESLADAAAAAKAGDEIVLIADAYIAEGTDVTIPNGVTLNGNGFAIYASGADHNTGTSYGYVVVGGELTIKGETKIEKFSASYYNHTVNIGEGASLEVFGKNRVTVGYGNTFNITGTLSKARTETKPSLSVAAGISFAGSSGVTFNVKNAYVSFGLASGKNLGGKFAFSFENSIVDFKNNLTFSSGSAVIDIDAKDSVLNMNSNLDLSIAGCDLTLDNSQVSVNSSMRNEGKITLTNGSTLTIRDEVALVEHGGNAGTITVDASTLTVGGTAANDPFDGRGTGSVNVINGGSASIGYISKTAVAVDTESSLAVQKIQDNSSVVIDAENYDGTSELNINIGSTDTSVVAVTVTGSDMLEVKNEDGKIVLAERTLSGEGSETNPYLINNVADLWLFAKIANAGNNFSGKYVKLTADIDLEEEDWTPISKFNGTFDGDGHKISNLWVTGSGNLGFIAQLADQTEHVTGTVKNVTFENVTILSNDGQAGLIADARLGARVNNVKLIGDVTIQGYRGVGGIVGAGFPVITGCSVEAEGTIHATYWGVGGILGFASDYGAQVKNATVNGTGEGLVISSYLGGAGGVTGTPYGAATNGATVSNIEVSSSNNYYMAYVDAGGTVNGTISVTDVAVKVNGEEIVGNDAVASIGTKGYFSLADAIAAAQNGETVTLLADVALASSLKIAAGKDVTLDLNGKTVSGVNNTNQGNLIYIENTGKLTVKDSAGNGKITYASGSSNVGFAVDVKGDFVLESGTIELTGSWSIGYAVDVRPNSWGTAYTAATTFVMNGGSVISSDGAVRVASSSASDHTNVSAAFTMNGGKIDAAWDGVFIQQSDSIYDVLSFTMNRGTIESDLNPVRVYGPAATDYVYGADCMNITLNDGTLTYTGTETYAWIIDGVLRAGGGSSIETILESGELTVSAAVAQSSELPEGYKWEENADGNFVAVAKDYVAQVGEQKFETVTEAINAANDGDTVQLLPGTITEYIAPWANDPTHASEKSITLVGAENFGTVLTGGLYLGYDDSQNRGHTITVKGIAFEGKGILVAGQDTVIIEGNKFTNITETVDGKTSSATANAISVIGKNVNAVIKNNEINTTVSGGINLRNTATVLVEGNTVTNTWDNSITVPGNTAEGTVVIRDNTLSNWGTSRIEGRAIRVKGGKATISGNVMTNAAAPEQFVKTTETTSLEVSANYWNGVSPMTDGMFSCDVSADPALILSSYYTDADKTNLVEISASVAKIGNAYFATLVEAIAAANAGETIELLADIDASEAILIGKSLTINGNDHKITSSATRIFRITTGNVQVTMNDLSMVSTAVRAGNVDSIRGISMDAGLTNVNLTLNDCSVDFTDATATDYSYAVNISGSGTGHTVTINGGSYEAANVINLWGNDHQVDVDGAVLTSIYGPNEQFHGAIVRVEGQIAKLEMTNNTFNGDHAKVVSYDSSASCDSVIDENNIDNTKRYVVKVGNTLYHTLEEAIAAANADETITLLANVELDATLTTNKVITIDGNGKKITTSSTFVANGSNAMIDIQKDITFENVVFDGVKNAAVMRAVSADVVMNNCVVQNCEQTVAQGLLRLACGNATITNSKFLNNSCTMVVSFGYDAANDDDVMIIDNCVFEGNTCRETAVVYFADGDYGKVTNTKFVNNTVTSAGNAATLYMGWGDGFVVNGCYFDGNSVTTTHATTKRFASAIFCDGCAVTGNVFGNNTATRNGETVSTVVAVGAYYGAADVSGNYWVDGSKPIKGDVYTVEYTRNPVALNSYYTAYSVDENGNVTLENLKNMPSGKVAYRAYITDNASREAVQIDLENIVANESLVINLYDANGNLLTTTTYKNGAVTAATFTCNIVLWGTPSGSWNTEIHADKLTVANAPATIEVVVDGDVTDTFTNAMGDKYPAYYALDCVYKEAKIGDTYYNTLAEAIAAANAGETITLLKGVVVEAGETLTLDKDVTITYTSNVPGEDMITNRGILNIGGNVKISYINTDATASNVTVSTISCEPGSVLNVTGGTVENKTVKADGSSIYSYAIDLLTNGNLGDVTVNISGGTIYSDYMAIRQFNNGDACKNTLNITGGYIFGAKRAVQVHIDNTAAYTTISGGKIEGGYALCFLTTSENVSVTGGEFIGDVWYSGTKGFISGGTFSTVVADKYIAEDYVLIDNGNETYTVKTLEESGYVAQNAETGEYYDDVFAALNAATAGQTVKLITDAEAPYFIVKTGVTLDLNGYVLTTEYAAAVRGAHVIDSALKGMLKTSVGSIVLNPANSMMAVYDDVNGGYVFTKFKFNFSQDAEYTGEGIKINALFAPDMRVIDLLKDGASTNDLKLMVRLTWGDESEDGDAVQEFIFKDATISRVFSSNGGTQSSFGRMFTMIVTGFDDVNNLRVNLVAESSTNAIVVSSKTLTVTN